MLTHNIVTDKCCIKHKNVFITSVLARLNMFKIYINKRKLRHGYVYVGFFVHNGWQNLQHV